MEQISIVRKRSRVMPIVIALIVLALLVAAALWFMGDAATTARLGWPSSLDGIALLQERIAHALA